MGSIFAWGVPSHACYKAGSILGGAVPPLLVGSHFLLLPSRAQWAIQNPHLSGARKRATPPRSPSTATPRRIARWGTRSRASVWPRPFWRRPPPPSSSCPSSITRRETSGHGCGGQHQWSHFEGFQCTTHVRTYLSGWIGMFTGTIWILTHGHMGGVEIRRSEDLWDVHFRESH